MGVFLGMFFEQCGEVLKRSNGKAEVHVTLKEGEPYASWRVGATCQKATEGKLQIKTAYPFHAENYPSYAHRRTIGFQGGFSKASNEEINKQGAKTFIFGWNKKYKEAEEE